MLNIKQTKEINWSVKRTQIKNLYKLLGHPVVKAHWEGWNDCHVVMAHIPRKSVVF